MSALRFARVIANSLHECAPDHSMHSIQVGELREVVEEMAGLYEALQQFVNGVETHMIDSPADDILANVTHRAKAALARASAEQTALAVSK